MLKIWTASALTLFSACDKHSAQTKAEEVRHTQAHASTGDKNPSHQTLPELKAQFQTRYRRPNHRPLPAPTAPSELFDTVKYPAPLGENSAYISRAGHSSDEPTAKLPAIVWIHGGFNFGIGSLAWDKAQRKNDQSAAALREAGLILMLPSLRGTNDSPGDNECFFGEVDDVIAAGEYLRNHPRVDPERVYLGGHSTGGTLALLTAASTDIFRSVFSFGPALSVQKYAFRSCIPRDAPKEEVLARTPGYFFRDIKTPTFIVEGSDGYGPYEVPKDWIGKAPITTRLVPGADHFSVLRPGSEVLASEILRDNGEDISIELKTSTIQSQMSETKP